jgi:serine/threonine-protein kinase
VVLPFQDIGEPDDEFFADGISEEITSRLSRIQGMRVIARNSALRFDPSATSAQDFGRRLGADYVLDGTVRWVRGAAGVRVRVTPALVDVRDAQQVWGEGYDAVVEDVLGIQSDISGKVVDALRVELGGDERQRLADAGTSDPEAQSEYLIGRFQWRKRTTDGLLQAVEHFQRAVDLDPNYARGWAGVADAVGLLPYFGIRHIPKAAAYDRAEQAARRALELDSTLAEGWASLCQVLQNGRWDWENAERACRRAVALDPDYATAHQWLGEVLLATGRLDEAVTAVARGAELDPFSPIIQNQLGFFLTGVGRMAEAGVAAGCGVGTGAGSRVGEPDGSPCLGGTGGRGGGGGTQVGYLARAHSRPNPVHCCPIPRHRRPGCPHRRDRRNRPSRRRL